ncbi:sulfite exporter TauE/SafE family protein [Nocardia sp. NPDC057668]|uniref:sulfite exporter TauE/SafE family protein n=1 Tax=Nocardia sp. NPDC057668 TaxID=3346202 RepID=UPI0036704CF0
MCAPCSASYGSRVLTSFLLLLCCGCLTGVTTVLFGFGGGFVTVPVVYAFSAATAGADAMHVAVATSAAVMIVNAALATVAAARTGDLRPEFLHPLALFIAVGAVAGAAISTAVPDRVLQLLFAAYLLITIADIVLRAGFITTPDRPGTRPMPLPPVSGVGIGAVAALLGVGGSVMTVPLLRRAGLPMSEAVAMANPLGLPVAVTATVVYALATPVAAPAGSYGHVDLVAAAGLLAGALPTIGLLKRSPPAIPDRFHAIIYPVFLTVVLVGMITAACAVNS